MKAKKSLGQHFLTSHGIVRDIISVSDLNLEDTVLEVGPGKGILTQELVKKAGRVIAVEKDDELSALLQNKFKQLVQDKKIEIINDDILNLELQNYGLQDRDYKVVANIPYYITGALIKYFLSADFQPSKMVLLVQKEVAFRIARSKKESMLSISVKAYGEPKYVKTISARHFKPQPNVDSAILAVNNISREFFSDVGEERFFEVVKKGFSHKRKLLTSNLRNFASKEKLIDIFEEINLNKKERAEDLSINQWKSLAKLSNSTDTCR